MINSVISSKGRVQSANLWFTVLLNKTALRSSSEQTSCSPIRNFNACHFVKEPGHALYQALLHMTRRETRSEWPTWMWRSVIRVHDTSTGKLGMRSVEWVMIGKVQATQFIGANSKELLSNEVLFSRASHHWRLTSRFKRDVAGNTVKNVFLNGVVFEVNEMKSFNLHPSHPLL